MSETKKHKTRHLTTFEFFEIIQIEYLCTVLRARIYPRTKDKGFWTRVAEGKRQTIESIALRNHLPSIFTDSDLEAAFQKRIYRDNTYPVFIYKDDEQKINQEYYDLLYYYLVGQDVRYDLGDGVLVGRVLSYIPFNDTLKVLCRETNKEKQVPVSCTVRIL